MIKLGSSARSVIRNSVLKDTSKNGLLADLGSTLQPFHQYINFYFIGITDVEIIIYE